jgi:hypothetical protein
MILIAYSIEEEDDEDEDEVEDEEVDVEVEGGDDEATGRKGQTKKKVSPACRTASRAIFGAPTNFAKPKSAIFKLKSIVRLAREGANSPALDPRARPFRSWQ